jgi:hypothetical protein
VIEYDGGELAPDDAGDGEDALAEAQLVIGEGDEPDDAEQVAVAVPVTFDALPKVEIRQEMVPPKLHPSQFLATMVSRVLDTTPINFHVEARSRRAAPR